MYKKFYSGVKFFDCKVCGKVFIFLGDLRSYERIYIGEKFYICIECGKLCIIVGVLISY